MLSPPSNRSLQFSPRSFSIPSPGSARPVATPFSDLRQSQSPRPGEAQDVKVATVELPETLKKLQAQMSLVIDGVTESEALRQDNIKLRGQLEKKDGDANGHLRELWAVRAQMQTQAKDLAAERETANNLREKLGMLRDEHAPMKLRVEELERALEQVKSELRQQQTDQELEMAALEQELAKERDFSAAKSDFALEKLRENEEKSLELQALQAFTEDLKFEVQELRACREQAKDKDAEEVRRVTAQQAAEVQAMKDQLEELERQAAERAAEQERQAAARESDVAEQERQAVEREAELAARVQQLEAACQSHERKMSEREAEFSDMMRQLEEHSTSNQEEWLSANKHKDEELERVQRTAALQVGELQNSIALLEQQVEEAGEREAQLVEKLIEVEEACKAEKARTSQERAKELKQVQEKLARREGELQGAKAELEEHVRESLEREAEFKELAQRLDEANKSKDKLQAKLKEQAKAAEATREKKNDLALVECVREKERTIVELQVELEHAREALSDKDEVIREQACELAELEVQHREQAERLHTCEISMERAEKQRVDPLRSIQCQYQDDIDVRMQNRDLLLTSKQLHQECEMLETENRSLKETNEYFIDELDQHANNIGHTNHKQKIRYTLKLKEELNRLFTELRKSRQRILHLEASQVHCGVLGGKTHDHRQATNREGHSVHSVRRHSTGAFSSPRRASPNHKKGSPRASPCSPGHEEANTHHRAEEYEHICNLQSVALEKLNVDHQHLKALVERVVLRCDYANGNGSAASTSELLAKLRGSAAQRSNTGVESHERVRPKSNRASSQA